MITASPHAQERMMKQIDPHAKYCIYLILHILLRKYERLDAIKEKFSAYPPFWYFIGNAANYVSENKQIDISQYNHPETYIYPPISKQYQIILVLIH